MCECVLCLCVCVFVCVHVCCVCVSTCNSMFATLCASSWLFTPSMLLARCSEKLHSSSIRTNWRSSTQRFGSWQRSVLGGGTNGTQSKSTARQCMFHSFLPLPAFFFVPLCHRLLCGCLQEEDELAELEAKAKLEAKLKLHRVSLSSKLMPILLCVCACALCVRVRCTPLGL